MDEGVGDSWSYKRHTAPVKSLPPNKPTPRFLQAGCPASRSTSSVLCQSTDGKRPKRKVIFNDCYDVKISTFIILYTADMSKSTLKL